ncbi:hypothetical protein Pan44_07110 [Caulifigura coniformis]|uniref:N-acetyltransferase domain-containing protein n=1 Tax=Caulifigura coniformis TaxID=2527983 RepID=A0A517S997_9PLAN|nr:N-acetyltransferase [Caulifigura coniformis]QDT52699.1 hypothetical protein Pan44_07110 [Caulifigura coniformis]
MTSSLPDELVFDEENGGDVAIVDQSTIDAFGQPAESQLVQALRKNGGFALSAVARMADRPVAHVGYSPLKVGGVAGQPPVLSLAPVSVAPQLQRRGVGTALIHWSLGRLRERGFPAVIVLGEPAFYRRFGFQTAANSGIECPFDVPAEYFMALELQPAALAAITGLVEYRPEFTAVT